MPRIDEPKAERLFTRAMAIFDGLASGHGEAILWHLALRHHRWGMTELARRFQAPGRIADSWSADGLDYRAWQAGNATAAVNLAMTHFNKRDLAGYRRWLRRAAQAGDPEAAMQLRRFETRLPHGRARDIGRGRPDLLRDGYWSQRRMDRRRSTMLAL